MRDFVYALVIFALNAEITKFSMCEQALRFPPSTKQAYLRVGDHMHRDFLHQRRKPAFVAKRLHESAATQYRDDSGCDATGQIDSAAT